MEQIVDRCGADVAGLAATGLPRARSEADLAGLLAEVAARVERDLQSHRLEDSPAPACASGCATCCVLNVATLPVEGAAIAAFLRGQIPGGEVPARAAALASFGDRVRWLEDRERAAHRLTCRFLDSCGACSVYAVRPLACRGASSLDAADCRAALAGDEDDGVVQMNMLQRALYDEARHALGGALERLGLDARPRDVSAMTAVFLGDAGVVGDYLAGRRLALDPI
jgi:hypothetical protein